MPGLSSKKANKQRVKKALGMQSTGKQAKAPKGPMPKKTWSNDKSVKKDIPTRILQLEGGHGVDLRSNTYQKSVKLEVVPTQNSIKSNCTMDFASVRSLALGPVLEALARGWATPAGSSVPYYAARYLYDSFKAVILGTFPTISSAPRWFWITCDALYPKEARFKTGSIQYRWELNGQDSFDPVTVMDGITLVFGYSTMDELNGLPILGSPIPYTLEAGEAAIASLFQFFGDDVWNKKESISAGDSYMGKDVSSFAAVYAEIGSAFRTTGGVATTLESEVFIRSPIFSQFAQYQTQITWRGFQEYRKYAGSPMSIIPRMMSFRSEKDLKSKVSPIYKFLNFDRFFEVLSLTLGSAFEVSRANNIGGSPSVCPLTSQQVQLLLRQTILQKTCNHFGQDLRYNSSSALDFYPFSVANNGVDFTIRTTTGMLLPQLLAENIRACGRQLTQDPQGQIHDLIPILGRYENPQLQNYNWTNPNDQQVLPVYSVDPAEIAVELISVSAVNPQNQQVVYLDLNGAQVEAWMVIWNQFMQSMAQNLTPLTCPGSEAGINALCVLPQTQHCAQVIITPVATPVAGTTAEKMKKKESTRKLQLGSKRVTTGVGLTAPGPGSDFFTRVMCASTSSTYPLNSVSWNIQKVMIKPDYVGDTSLGFEGSVTAQQVFQVEPYLLVSVPDGDGVSLIGDGYSRIFLYEQHLQMAKMDIRSALAEEGTEVERALNSLIAMGRGGWFTSLAGTFLEGVGVKGAKGVTDVIGQITGF